LESTKEYRSQNISALNPFILQHLTTPLS